jgi:hypothetical protein
MVRLVLALMGAHFFRKSVSIRVSRAFRRARACAVRKPSCPVSRWPTPLIPARRGDIALANTAWRRLSPGTNRISSFGVWRVGARRAASRANRTGETRWHHMPGRPPAGNFHPQEGEGP